MEFDYPRQKKENEGEGFSVQGSIRDCFALRKLVPDYRPINRRPDKLLKYPLINQFDVHLFQPKQKTDNRLSRSSWPAAGEEKFPLIKLSAGQHEPAAGKKKNQLKLFGNIFFLT